MLEEKYDPIGEVPGEIGNLCNITYLGVQSNKLSGEVLAIISNLSALVQITLAGNRFSGNLPSDIDVKLPNLEEFLLTDNGFSGIIPSSITNISKLSSIQFGNNSFSGHIHEGFGNLRSLTKLVLYDNNLTASWDMRFLLSLANCQKLQQLSLDNNPLNGILPRYIGNLSKTMEIIEMPRCHMTGTIPQEIGNLSQLVILSLGFNQWSGMLPITMGRMENLQGIDLSNSKIEGSVPNELCR